MTQQRTDKEINKLFDLITALPKAKTEHAPDAPKQKSDSWKSKTSNSVHLQGRVNKTRGK